MSRFHKGPSKKQLEKIVSQFNARFPIGTQVILQNDSGPIETEVEAPALVLSGHSAVAKFSGVSGYYSIEDNRVRLAGDAIGKAKRDLDQILDGKKR